ncbi:hypothetical protein AB7W88_07080 [Providencia vermicola]|uniref:Uncharacterized protein n=3 Tax=Providencia TaxID=586 RepID=A0AAI9MVU5_PROST|nr:MULTISPECIES: hypothetical protein [Providencia]ELR5045846.1 hypothetical protein [Providencia rettgeri]ELR5036158.1 hypothetical protein [Providencia stuartii]ELR5120780.1 hypothetical protein [Providencia stuartii]ELR5144311.1 hypothetical protein [Providencia stuartii]ELR5293367.1 hypothetical protein [Providencia stuartii]
MKYTMLLISTFYLLPLTAKAITVEGNDVKPIKKIEYCFVDWVNNPLKLLSCSLIGEVPPDSDK